MQLVLVLLCVKWGGGVKYWWLRRYFVVNNNYIEGLVVRKLRRIFSM